MNIKGILSFVYILQPREASQTIDASYKTDILLPPGDPQIAVIQQAIHAAGLVKAPQGLAANAHVPMKSYDEKYGHKDYYDPRLKGYMVVSAKTGVHEKPEVVDSDYTPLMDTNKVCAGAIAWVNLGIAGFGGGNTGIAPGVKAYLNGVMATGEMGPFGRLDNKPSVQQMFEGVSTPAGAQPMPAQAAPPMPAAAPPIPASAPQYVMTPAAQGFSREDYIAQGWTDTQLVQQGLMQPPAATPSFG